MIGLTFRTLTIGCAALAALASGPAAAQKFEARLLGYNEVPSVATAGTGRFKAKIDEAAGTIFWELEYSGMQADVTQSHIHFGQRHTTGGITIWLCQSTTNPAPAAVAAVTPTCGARSASLNGTVMAAHVLATATTQQLPAGGFAQVVKAIRAAAAYANVHTTASPGGEIRGQIRKGHDSDDGDEGQDED